MNDAQPRAEAVAVKDGASSPSARPRRSRPSRARRPVVTDLAGRTLIPGFVDAHGHIFAGGIQALSANLLAPPDGEVTDIASLQQTMRDWIADNQRDRRGRQPDHRLSATTTRNWPSCAIRRAAELDAVSTDVPDLHRAPVRPPWRRRTRRRWRSPASPPTRRTPPGGVSCRDASGEPTGVLEENAHYRRLREAPVVAGPERDEGPAQGRGRALGALRLHHRDGGPRPSPAQVEVMKEVAAEGGFKIDVVTHMEVLVRPRLHHRQHLAATM